MRPRTSELASWRKEAWARWPSLPAVEAQVEGPAGSAHGAELVLVAAVLAGQPAALEVLERSFLQPLRLNLVTRWPDDVVDDALQSLRERLLLGDAPLLRTWPGRDALARWLRICALREVMTASREKPSLPSSPAVVSAGELPHRHREALERAVIKAVEQLDATQRGILKLHLLENVSVESIAMLHSVSRATMTRWLSAARRALADAVREAGREELDVGDATLDSLARPIISQLDVSLAGLLREKA